jgi:anti-sigma-K factor RskA
MNSADLHTLTGAYVLHALAPQEEAEFERHLQACPPCSQEVRELAATAGRLGSAESATPPPELKHQVMARVAAERQDRPRVTRQAHRGMVRRGRAVSRFVLAACVAAAASLGGVAVWQHEQASDARAQTQRAQRTAAELAAVLAAPDAKVSTGPLTDGATGTVVVSRSRNRATFYASGLPKPPRGKVYQLWFDDGGRLRSAGLMELTATSGAVLMEGPVNSASAMGVTVEPAGGSSKPTSAPLALMNLPT